MTIESARGQNLGMHRRINGSLSRLTRLSIFAIDIVVLLKKLIQTSVFTKPTADNSFR